MLLDKENIDKIIETLKHYTGISLQDRKDILRQKLLPLAKENSIGTFTLR